MADISWRLPKPSDGGFWLSNPSESGGPASNGAEQNLVSMSMFIKGKLTVDLRTAADILEARSFFAEAAGKAGDIIVPFFDGKRANWPVDAWGRTLKPAFTRTPSLDGTPYASAEIPDDSEIHATLDDDMALHATTCNIHITQGEPLRRGQWFSLGGRRAYLIRGVSVVIAGTQAVRFYPPARAEGDEGDVVELARPVCVMNQTSDDQGVQVLERMQRTTLTLEFREAIGPASAAGSGS